MTRTKEILILANEMIQETAGYGSISIKNREAIKKYIGWYGSDMDELIQTFYSINIMADNGGAPILRKIINQLEEYEITIAQPTNGLILKKGTKVIDVLFINRLIFETMSMDNLLEAVKELAQKHQLSDYAVNL